MPAASSSCSRASPPSPDPPADAAGHQAADRGRRPLGEDARRPAPLRRAQDRRVGRGAGEALEPRPLLPGGLREIRSGPTASRSGRSSASSTRACRSRWSVSATTTAPALVAEDDTFRVYQVRWPVLEGVHGEGLLLEPKGEVLGHVVALPDADQTPEQVAGLAPGVAAGSQFARRLATNGFRVVVPTLISRGIEFSGNPRIAMTNQPHREWIYRQAYQMGRHVIGYEVQKVLAAVDWIERQAGAGGEGRRRRLRRGRADRLLRRGRGPAHRRGAGQRLLRPAAAGLGRADLPQRLGPAPRVRRRRDRHADRPARAGGRVQRGAARRGPAGRAEGAARRGRGGRARHAGAGRRPARVEAARRPPPRGLPGARPRPRGRRGGGRLRRPGGRAGSSPRLLGVALGDGARPGRRPADRRKGFSTRTSASGVRSRSWRTTSSASSAVPTRRATRSSSRTRR